MAKQKLLEDIRLKPARYYRLPGDVMRDRRFGNAERLEILGAWLADPGAFKPQIESTIEELQARMAPGHAA
jgi:hypothetical protein